MPDMDAILRELVAERSDSLVLVLPDRNVVEDDSRSSECTTTPASMVLGLRFTRSSPAAPCGPPPTLATLPLTRRGIELHSPSKQAVFSLQSSTFEAIFRARSFAYFYNLQVLGNVGRAGDHNAQAQRWFEYLTAFD